MSDVRTPELVINKLSKQQYENIQNPSDTELYLVPEDEEHKPICYPTTASKVGITSMLVKSSVSDNGKILTENGFVYNTSGNPTISDTKVICDLGVGFMEKVLENLTQNTEYHIKSYAQNSSGLVYGSELVQRTTGSPIPAEYQLVEYLQSNGTQYIVIDNSINASNIIEVTFEALNQSTTEGIFGAREGGSGTKAYMLMLSNGSIRGLYNTTNYDSYNRSYTINTKYKVLFDVNQLKTYINDILWFNITQTTGFIVNRILYLFNSYAGNSFVGGANIKLYKFKYGNAELYPVYRIADNKPGMYDIVNGVFYTNQGTGEFTVGPDKEWDE